MTSDSTDRTPRPAAGASAADAAEVEALIGRRLGRFRIVESLGRGTMGQVLKARDQTLRRHVALKVVPYAADEPQQRKFLGQFIREARSAAALIHPHIVQILEVGRTRRFAYIAMELLEGGNLEQRVAEEGPLDHARACRWCAEAADGLDYAHGRGIIHRDIKPANIMLTDSGHAKVGDFGLARFTDQPTEGFDEQYRVVGTPYFMAPEVARGEQTRQSDIFALGGVLWYVLTGDPPFPVRRLQDVLKVQRELRLDDVRGERPDVPRELAHILDKALAREPEDRYASAGEMAADLRQAAVMDAQPITPARPARHAVRPRGRGWRETASPRAVGLTAAIVALLLALAAGATILALSWLRDEPGRPAQSTAAPETAEPPGESPVDAAPPEPSTNGAASPPSPGGDGQIAEPEGARPVVDSEPDPSIDAPPAVIEATLDVDPASPRSDGAERDEPSSMEMAALTTDLAVEAGPTPPAPPTADEPTVPAASTDAPPADSSRDEVATADSGSVRKGQADATAESPSAAPNPTPDPTPAADRPIAAYHAERGRDVIGEAAQRFDARRHLIAGRVRGLPARIGRRWRLALETGAPQPLMVWVDERRFRAWMDRRAVQSIRDLTDQPLTAEGPLVWSTIHQTAAVEVLDEADLRLADPPAEGELLAPSDRERLIDAALFGVPIRVHGEIASMTLIRDGDAAALRIAGAERTGDLRIVYTSNYFAAMTRKFGGHRGDGVVGMLVVAEGPVAYDPAGPTLTLTLPSTTQINEPALMAGPDADPVWPVDDPRIDRDVPVIDANDSDRIQRIVETGDEQTYGLRGTIKSIGPWRGGDGLAIILRPQLLVVTTPEAADRIQQRFAHPAAELRGKIVQANGVLRRPDGRGIRLKLNRAEDLRLLAD